MIVDIVNITDGPGKAPVQVDIYNKTLDPGQSLRIPLELVTEKLRKLEKEGLIAIGSLPPWYLAAKKRVGRTLTPEEMAQRVVTPKSPEISELRLTQVDAPVLVTDAPVEDIFVAELKESRRRKG